MVIPEGKRHLGRARCRWENNIEMDLREVGCYPGEWIGLTVYRDQCRADVRVVMNFGFLISQLVYNNISTVYPSY